MQRPLTRIFLKFRELLTFRAGNFASLESRLFLIGFSCEERGQQEKQRHQDKVKDRN